jgi:hypothetical protein
MTYVKPEIVYIPVKQLSVTWVQTQRPYNEKWARTIADELDPDKFDPIIVTKPNGENIYHIIEGQHRRHALEMYAARLSPTGRGDSEQAPCRIVADANPARAAEIWLGINSGRKAVRPIHGFKIAVVAEREPEVAINQLVVNNHFTIAEQKRKNNISAVSALKIIFERHGRMTLNNVLKSVRLLWDGDPQSVTAPMLKGFGIFIHEFGTHIDNKRLVAKVGEKWSPFKLAEAAEARKSAANERLDEAISELLIREYNKGLREGLKLRHKE